MVLSGRLFSRRSLGWAPVLLCALSPADASAERVLLQQDGWTVAEDRQSNAIACYGYINYPSGTRLVIDARASGGAATWSILLGEHGGNPDVSGRVEAVVDGQTVFSGTAVPMANGKGARLSPISDEGIRQLSVGNVLDVNSATPRRYSIPGSSAAVQEIARCINSSGIAVVAALDKAADANAVLFNVRANIPGGFANMRSGPGVAWPVVAKIPVGETGLRRQQPCKAPDDGRTKFPWCPLVWRGASGYVSLANLESAGDASPQPQSQPDQRPPVVVRVDPPRPDPPKKPEPEAEKGPSTGTGFFVSTAGHILTNAHVVDECRQLSVQPLGGLPEAARVMALDRTNDLALILSPIKPPYVPVLSTAVRTGDTVAVYGFPLSGGLSRTGNFTVGTISAIAGLYDNTSQIQISAPVQPGNSGGPVLDGTGNIIGVVVSKLNALAVANKINDIPQNVNFAIKSSVALNFLETNSVPFQSPTLIATIPLTNPDLAERARTFTVFITCGG
jgi:S1-C subfamily serine protease